MIDLGQYQNDITKLGSLSPSRYENIFKLYLDGNNDYFYNILNSINIPEEIDKTYYYVVVVNRRVPWTTISYEQYQNIDLWWLICLINNINNPIKFAEPGKELKIIRQEFVPLILNNIKNTITL